MKSIKYSNSKPVTSITVSINSDSVNRLIATYRNEKNFNLSFGDVVLHSISKKIPELSKLNSNFSNKTEMYPHFNAGYLVNLNSDTDCIVIDNCNSKSLTDISKEIKEGMLRYIRNDQPSQVTAPTFLVTNMSTFSFKSLVSPLSEDQSSVFVICPEYDDFILDSTKSTDSFFDITLSFDSRISDCQKVISFLNSVKNYLESIK